MPTLAEEHERRDRLMERIVVLWGRIPNLKHPNPKKQTFELSVYRLLDWALKNELPLSYNPFVTIYLNDVDFLVGLVESELDKADRAKESGVPNE